MPWQRFRERRRVDVGVDCTGQSKRFANGATRSMCRPSPVSAWRGAGRRSARSGCRSTGPKLAIPNARDSASADAGGEEPRRNSTQRLRAGVVVAMAASRSRSRRVARGGADELRAAGLDSAVEHARIHARRVSTACGCAGASAKARADPGFDDRLRAKRRAGAVRPQIESRAPRTPCLPPPHDELVVGAVLDEETAAERGMRVAQPNQRAKLLHDRTLEGVAQLVAPVVVPIDVAADAGTREQLEIVLTREQADVVDLRNARREELDRAREQIVAIVARRERRRRCSSLIEIEVRCGGARREPARAAAVARGSLRRAGRARRAARGRARSGRRVRADVDDADAVVRIEHRQRIRRPDTQPFLQALRRAERERMQHERRQARSRTPRRPAARSRSASVVGVNLHEHFHAERDCARRASRSMNSKVSGIMKQRRAGLLDGVADGVEAHHADAGSRRTCRRIRSRYATACEDA